MRLSLGLFWTLPNTLLGLLAALLGGGRYSGCVKGAILFVPRSWGFWRWFFSQGWGGITIGECVFLATPNNDSLLNHELRHVWQYRCLGPLFLPAYGLASVWAWMRGQDYYRSNIFERDAERNS